MNLLLIILIVVLLDRCPGRLALRRPVPGRWRRSGRAHPHYLGFNGPTLRARHPIPPSGSDRSPSPVALSPSARHSVSPQRATRGQLTAETRLVRSSSKV